jgi:hypothetical protein
MTILTRSALLMGKEHPVLIKQVAGLARVDTEENNIFLITAGSRI